MALTKTIITLYTDETLDQTQAIIDTLRTDLEHHQQFHRTLRFEVEGPWALVPPASIADRVARLTIDDDDAGRMVS